MQLSTSGRAADGLRLPLLLLLTATLSACNSPTATAPSLPAPTATAPQTPTPSPTTPPTRNALGGLYQLDLTAAPDGLKSQATIHSVGAGLSAQSVEVQGLTFVPVSATVSTHLPSGKRYMRASFTVTNTGSKAVQLPTYVPVATSGSVATVGDTPFRNIKLFDGSDAPATATGMSMVTARLISSATGQPELDGSATPFGDIASAGLQISLPAGTQLTRIFNQGWTGTALPAGGQQMLTLGVELPKASDPRQDPYTFSLLFAVMDAGEGTLAWSDPASWPSGKVPAAGEQVTLPAGKKMVLDTSTPELGGLTVPAGSTLEFAEKDLTLKSEWLMVHGTLQIGTEARPFAHQANILLTNNVPGEDIMGMGDRVLGVMDGALELHGQKPTAWTRLNATAPAGSTTLTLEQAPNWKPGDALTLATTDFASNQTEQVTVQSISGNTVTLATPLNYTHWAASTTYGPYTLSEKAEVGLLTHNIRIGATDDASTTGLGAHTMLMGQSQGRIEGVEFLRVGQRNQLRRYPVHFHLLGSQGASYFRNNSVHHSFNRCVTIHGTSDLTLQDNVTFNTVGHCFFLEDGNETGNTIAGNLVTLVRRPDTAKGETPLLPSDQNPSGYWVTNPANFIKNNVAAGVDGTGFWLAFPEHPTGLATQSGAATWNRRTPLGSFSGNVAHGTDRGLNVDDGPNPDGTTSGAYYDPRSNPADPESAPVPATFSNFTAYKNRDHGAWLRGENLTLDGARLADNAVGATLAAYESAVTNSLLVGETANVGRGESWEPTGQGGRSLPRPWDASFPIRGFQFYDGHVSLSNATFAGFMPSSTRRASGLGYLVNNAFSLQPDNNAQGLNWLDGSNRVYLVDPAADKDGDRNATFLDSDGSVTGTAGQSVTASPLLKDAPDCAPNATWNASVCAGTYARLWLEDVNTGKPGPVTISNSRGSAMPLVGVPGNFSYFSASVRLGESYGLAPAGSTNHWRVGLTNRSKLAGNTVTLSLPLGSEPYLYADWWIDERSRPQKVSLAALPSTNVNSYAYEGGKLYLKLVSKASAYAVIDICSNALCK